MMNTVRMTTAQALVRYIANQYVERDGREQRFIEGVWGIFGHGNVAGVGQALEELGEKVGLRYYRPQNEQAMVHAAIAYAKHKNRLATFACTTSIGPGATNMVTAAAVATVNRLPVLLLPSDYFANRVPDPVLQQVEHTIERDVSASDTFRPVSRFFDRVSRPEQLLASLPEAFRVLTDPAETGAVTITLPEDVQTEAFDWPEAFFEQHVWHVRRPLPEPELLDAALSLLQAAERPIIIAGGGTIYAEATEELGTFAERWGIPVLETQAGKGALPWDHPYCAGPLGPNGGIAANALAREADLILAVGTRLADFTTASRTAFQNPQVRVIGLNVMPMDANKLRGLPLVADAKRGLVALHEKLEQASYRGSAEWYRDEVAQLESRWVAAVDDLRTIKDRENLGQSEVIGAVNEAVGGHATVICAAGSLPGDLLKLWRPEDPKAYHLEYGYSCMGYEVAAGLGVALADPKREVVVMVGDGSYLMMNSEIVTAVAEGLKFTIVLIDNNGFQCIVGLQRAAAGEDLGNELRFRDQRTGTLTGPYVRVDFVKHAEAMGALAIYAPHGDALHAALAQAKQADGVTVIVVPVDPEKRTPGFEGWWDVPVAEVSGRTSTQAIRSAYSEAIKKQRPLL
jgi:3D-(3,5/4)-trihydroxycyclohexane-1,2-dione acylhydrolase (decyclizing)